VRRICVVFERAVEWGELERLPCAIKLLPNPKKTMGFHDFDQYERLLTVARKRGTDAYLMVLAGVMQDCGWGRSSRSNGAISTWQRAVSPLSDPTGSDTSRCRKAGGPAGCR
jgi:hypothetical protein